MKALLIIDVQENLMERKLYNKDVFISTVNNAIDQAREAGYPLIFIQHNNNFLVAGETGWQIFSGLHRKLNDPVVQKRHSDAFKDTALKQQLTEKQVDEIIICGLVTHGCIKHSCLGGIKNGFKVSILKGGHTSWAKDAAEKIEKTEAELKTKGIDVGYSIIT